MNESKKILGYVGLGVGAILATTLFFGSYYSVSDYETAVVTRFGRIQGTYQSGFHFKMPWFDSVYVANHKLTSTKTKLNTYVKDGSNDVTINYDYSYRLNRGDKTVRNTFTNFGTSFDFKPFLNERIANATRDIVANYEITEVNNNRGLLKDKVVISVNKDIMQYGIKLETMAVSIEYGASYKDRLQSVKDAQAKTALEAQKTKQAMEQAKREKVEAEKIAELAKIDADQRRYVTETNAQAEANEVTMKSKANAEAVTREGEAKAKAILAENDALKQVSGLIEYKKAEAELVRANALGKWDGKMKVPTQIITGNGSDGKLPIFPFLDAMKGVK